MKAVVKLRKGMGQIALVEKEKPVAGPGEVVVKVIAAGVCGTDIKILREETWSNPPVTLGHEYSGVVDSVGDGVRGYKAGDRVVSETGQVVCGTCPLCKTGRQLMCRQRLSIGYGVDGAFAQYIKVRQEILHRLPDEVSFEQAALCEPFAVVLHGLWDSGNILPTDVVAVMGPGAIGQLAAQAATARGATVILSGTEEDEARLEIAQDCGIAHTTTSLDEAYLRGTIGREDVDVVVDCSGAQAAIRNGMKLLKPTGKLIQIGLTSPAMEIDYALLTSREISIIGTFGHQWHNWEQAIDLMRHGKAAVGRLITGHYPIEKWEDAFGDMAQQRGIKALIHPN